MIHPQRHKIPPPRGGRGIVLGLAFGVAVLGIAAPPVAGLSDTGLATAGIGVMMAILWMSEALPLAATALIPVALFPLLGILDMDSLAASYADPLIFLFLGGFLIARAIERWGLHRRLAHLLVARSSGDAHMTVLAVMAATAFLSLWISNTASAMVMTPIAASLAALRNADDGFDTALLLGVAYAATIGGMGSLIGTPPNALFAAYMADTHGIEIGFAAWLAIGLPVVAVLLPVTWLILTRGAFRLDPSVPLSGLHPPGAMTAAEKRTGMIAALAALGWISRPALAQLFPDLGLSDAGIAMLAAIALFLVPAGGQAQDKRLLDWETARSLRWDVLILFGGGLALASAIGSSGLAGWIGTRAEALDGLPLVLLLTVFAALIVYLGELASNTAMSAIFLPVAGATALGLGADPLVFAVPVALAASVGFMLPVATPPNAIVFGTSLVSRQDMLRAGVWLDGIGIVVALAIGAGLGPLVFSAFG